MTVMSSLLAFTVVAALLTITPGLDTVLVLRTAASEGPRHAIGAALGIVVGCVVWGIAVAIGLGALLAASPLLFEIIKLAGAAYLLWLGGQLLLKPRREGLSAPGTEELGSGRSWFLRGLATNLLNPKAGVFYLSLLPQFVPNGVSVPLFTMFLACIHAALGIAWFAMLIAVTRPIAGFVSRPETVIWLDRLTGGLLAAAGAKVGFEALRALRA